MTEFDGRTVLVTGAASGIGRATAESFAAKGALVTAVDRDSPAVEHLTREIAERGGQAIGVGADVRIDADVATAVAAARDAFGDIDIVVNSAGIQGRYASVAELGEDDWDAVIDTNLKSVFLVSHHCIPSMRSRGGGAIVHIASVQAFATQLNVPAYAASKGAIVALTKAMALDHAVDGIRVNCVAPGSVDTPMLHAAAATFSPTDPMSELAKWGAAHPLQRLTTAEDVAALVMFLASESARTITGGAYVIDAGLLARLGV